MRLKKVTSPSSPTYVTVRLGTAKGSDVALGLQFAQVCRGHSSILLICVDGGISFFFAACRLKEKKAKCLASVNIAASLLSTNLGSYVYSFTTSLELLPYCVECTEGPCPGSSLTTGSLPMKMLLRRCLAFSGESAVSLQKLDTPVLTYSSELSQVHPC